MPLTISTTRSVRKPHPAVKIVEELCPGIMVTHITFGKSNVVVWRAIYRLFSAIVDLISVRRLAEHEQDLELVLLRQQLDMLQRTGRHGLRMVRSGCWWRSPPG